MQYTKPCLNCGQTIIKPYNESLKSWENRHKYCSRSCSASDRKIGLKTQFKLGQKALHPISKGQHLSPNTQFKKGHTKTDDWYKKMRGRVPWNKNKRFTQITGEKHFAWKGGISGISRMIRALPESKNWRNLIFIRDKYTCQICYQVGYKLEADHLKSFAVILEENNILTIQEATDCKELWDTKNGRTLCVPCHKKTDTYGTKSSVLRRKSKLKTN